MQKTLSGKFVTEAERQTALNIVSELKRASWLNSKAFSHQNEPPPGLLMSMAIRWDHALGLDGYYDQFGKPGDHKLKLESTLRDMRRLWEEVTGRGFFQYPDESQTDIEVVELEYTLLPCPFCGHQPFEDNLIDSVHPENHARTLWTVNCLTTEGGCDASMLGGSREEAIRKWNTRVGK